MTGRSVEMWVMILAGEVWQIVKFVERWMTTVVGNLVEMTAATGRSVDDCG